MKLALRTRVGIAAAAVVLLAFGAGVLLHVRTCMKFRAQPEWRVFAEELSQPDVLSPLTRYLIFKPGEDIYREQLWDWMRSIEFKSAARDRENLAAFFTSLDARQLILLSRSLAESPELLVPHLKSKVFPASARCYFSRLSSDSDEGWDLSDDPDEPAWTIAYAKLPDPELRARILECLAYLDSDSQGYFPLLLLPTDGPDATKALDTLSRKANFGLLARASITPSPFGDSAARWVAQNLGNANADTLLEVMHRAEANQVIQAALFKYHLENTDDRAIEPLRNLIVSGHREAAQSVTSPLVSSPEDSSLKKDVIVILARNGIPLGVRNVDKAFQGSAPRREKFFSHNDYVRSATARQYATLSGHEYVQTGKRFPAVHCVPPPPAEVDELRAFIDAYPWFPGTDDAQLRLVSRLLLDGNFVDAKHELEVLNTAEYPDVDAKEFYEEANLLLRRAQAGTYTPPTLEQNYDESQAICNRQGDAPA